MGVVTAHKNLIFLSSRIGAEILDNLEDDIDLKIEDHLKYEYYVKKKLKTTSKIKTTVLPISKLVHLPIHIPILVFSCDEQLKK